MNPNGFQVLALDFDGVIVDSNEIKTQAIATLFSGEDPADIDAAVALHKRHLGLDRIRKFELIYRSILDRPLTAAAAKQLAADYGRIVMDKVIACAYMPGAREFLDQMVDCASICIVSATPSDELAEILERRNLSSYFDGVFGSPQSKTDALNEICDIHDIEPDQLLFIGDSIHDYQSAKVVGANFIGVDAGYTPNPFPSDVTRIRSLEDLLERTPAKAIALAKR